MLAAQRRHESLRIRVSEVHERALLVDRRHLQRDEIVARAERSVFGAELDSRVVRARHRDPVDEVDAMRVAERLVGFFAHGRREPGKSIARSGTAVLDVEMEDQRLAPRRPRTPRDLRVREAESSRRDLAASAARSRRRFDEHGATGFGIAGKSRRGRSESLQFDGAAKSTRTRRHCGERRFDEFLGRRRRAVAANGGAAARRKEVRESKSSPRTRMRDAFADGAGVGQ